MAAGRTYTPIARTALTSSTATITFSSIPSTYTDLILVINATSSAGADIWIRPNSDSSSNYSYTSLWGTGSAAASGIGSNLSEGMLTDYYGTPSNTEANITIFQLLNYANTTTYKTGISRSNRSNSGTDATVSLWRSTAAISSLLVRFNNGTTFSSGSTFTLYGIAAA